MFVGTAPTVGVTVPGVEAVHAPKPASEVYPGEHPVSGTPDGQKLSYVHGMQFIPFVVVSPAGHVVRADPPAAQT